MNSVGQNISNSKDMEKMVRAHFYFLKQKKRKTLQVRFKAITYFKKTEFITNLIKNFGENFTLVDEEFNE